MNFSWVNLDKFLLNLINYILNNILIGLMFSKIAFPVMNYAQFSCAYYFVELICISFNTKVSTSRISVFYIYYNKIISLSNATFNLCKPSRCNLSTRINATCFEIYKGINLLQKLYKRGPLLLIMQLN